MNEMVPSGEPDFLKKSRKNEAQTIHALTQVSQ